MVKIIIITFIFLNLANPCLVSAKSCEEQSLSQSGMDECYLKNLRDTESRMNNMLDQIIKKNFEEPLFIDKFKAAQKAWEIFRDAELLAIYPHANDDDVYLYYGRVYIMCYYIERTELTLNRIKQLNQWVEGVHEEDVCVGSRSLKQSKKIGKTNNKIKKPIHK